MTNDHLPPDLDTDRLARDLADLAHARIPVPAAIDEVVLDRARASLSAGGARAGRRRLLTRGVAAAAVLALAIAGTRALLPGPSGPGDDQVSVTILDAFDLARRIADGTVQPADDLNADGRTDERDVEALAMLAVSLDQLDQREDAG